MKSQTHKDKSNNNKRMKLKEARKGGKEKTRLNEEKRKRI
jgi:hypothetical protein